MYYESVNKNYLQPCLQTHYFTDIPFNKKDIYLKVDATFENRLDKVSYQYYNTVRLWWVIAQASNLRNPFNVPIGTILRIPPYETLFKLKGLDL